VIVVTKLWACLIQALGSVVTNFYADSAPMLLSNGMVISMGLSGVLLYASNWIGTKFDEFMESGHIVGSEHEANLGEHVEPPPKST